MDAPVAVAATVATKAGENAPDMEWGHDDDSIVVDDEDELDIVFCGIKGRCYKFIDEVMQLNRR